MILKYDIFSPVGPYPLVLQRFTSTGTVLGPPIVVGELSDFGGADAAVDRNGNLYVTWTVPTELRHARAFRPDGTPVGPAVDMPESAGYYVKTARLPGVDFVNVWDVDQVLYCDVVSLCVPGSAVCGDGTLDTLCERCDDSPANSDTTPDACRIDCERARCADGVVDGGEGCDDGNNVDCDGCSGACVPEPGLGCGDGVPFPACGEPCDHGNAIEGDGCVSCTLERGLGGGSVGTDCFTAWSIDNPANEPRYAKSRAISDSQVCTDNDPRCDSTAVSWGAARSTCASASTTRTSRAACRGRVSRNGSCVRRRSRPRSHNPRPPPCATP